MCGHGSEPQLLPDRPSTSRIARPGSPGCRAAARGVHRGRLGDKVFPARINGGRSAWRSLGTRQSSAAEAPV